MRRFTIPVEAAQYFLDIAISPMGDRVAFAAGRGNAGRILVRSLDRLDMEEVPDSDGGMMPFFSHDGSTRQNKKTSGSSILAVAR